MSPLPSDVTTEAAPVGNRHPLQEFVGDLVDINQTSEVAKNEKKTVYNIATFDFANIEVIAANEPYNFPTTQVALSMFNIPGTNWEEFKKSIKNCGFNGALNDLIGKRIHMKWASAMLSNRNQLTGKYELGEGWCWQVVGIEGVTNTGSQLMDAIVTMADGHTADEFKASVLADPNIRTLTGYTDILGLVMGNQILPTLVAGGKLTLAGDKYTKV